MNRFRSTNAIGVSFCLLVVLVFLFGCGQSNQSNSTLQSALVEISSYTGLQFPVSSQVLNYSSGWDERYLKLSLDNPELSLVLASTNLTQLSAIPKEIDGMNPVGIQGWWHPRSLPAYIAYEGVLQGTTNANGRFFLVVEDAKSPKRLVYVYFFKT